MTEPGAPDVGLQLPAVRVKADRDGHRRLVTTRTVPAGGIIAPVPGTFRRQPSRYSLQIADDLHLDELGPVEGTNHACEPSAFIEIGEDGLVRLRALRDLEPGDEVTIDYCATEWDMTFPFPCSCGSEACYGIVRGFRHLDPSRRAALLPTLSPHLRTRVTAVPLP